LNWIVVCAGLISCVALVLEDKKHDIQLRTMSWQKAAALLCGDQVCLAIMAQVSKQFIYTAQSTRINTVHSLGLYQFSDGRLNKQLTILEHSHLTRSYRGAGIVTMVLSGALFWITSITMHKFIMKNPQIMDICDFGYYAFGKSRIAYEFTGFMLLVNNIMLIGFHIFTGAKILNTLSAHSQCTTVFSIIITIIGIVLSFPRTLKHVSYMSMFSAACMGIAILLFMVFAGIEKAPLYGYGGNYPTQGEVFTYGSPPKGVGFVDAMNAVLNITFLWVPQILFPTFISEVSYLSDAEGGLY
jgi:hypothetical protein